MSWLAEIKDGLSLVLLSFPSYFAFVLNCINLTKLSSPKFVQSGKDNFSQGVWLFFGAHGLQVFLWPKAESASGLFCGEKQCLLQM